MTLSPYMTGLTMGLSLIMAIGAQNAFVLKQGLLRNHVLAICLVCSLSDAALILVGVTGMNTMASLIPWLEPLLRFGGAAFLFWYGGRSLLAALRSGAALSFEGGRGAPFWPTVLTCLALTWLNPHVYLDTVLLLGTLSTRFPGAELVFAAGAMSGSFLFFFSLGFGARWLRPVFSRPIAWRILDGAIALVMGSIAVKLLIGL